MKHILLTGATGFLGSHLLESLLQQGDQVTIIKRSTSDTWRIKHLLDQVEIFDIDTQPLEDAFQLNNFDAVIHTACSYGRSSEPVHKVVETNLLFGLRLLDAAIFYKVKIFINTDTFFNTESKLSSYLNSYSLSKRQFSEWLKQRSGEIKIINMKLHHMYGPKDDKTKFVSWLISQFKRGVESIPLTAGEQKRDFIYIEDVISAYLLILKESSNLSIFEEFDVGTGVLTTVREFSEKISQEYSFFNPGNRTKLDFGKIPMHQGELINVSVNNSQLVNLGWSPKITVSQGIKEIIKLEI